MPGASMSPSSTATPAPPCRRSRAAIAARGWAAVVSSTHSHLSTRTRAKRGNWDRFRAAGRAQPTTDGTPAALPGNREGLPAGDRRGRARWSGGGGRDVTFEHQPCPKFRIAIPLLRPWTAAAYDDRRRADAAWKERVEALAAALRLDHDQACTDTSRLFFLPRRPADGPPPGDGGAGRRALRPLRPAVRGRRQREKARPNARRQAAGRRRCRWPHLCRPRDRRGRRPAGLGPRHRRPLRDRQGAAGPPARDLRRQGQRHGQAPHPLRQRGPAHQRRRRRRDHDRERQRQLHRGLRLPLPACPLRRRRPARLPAADAGAGLVEGRRPHRCPLPDRRRALPAAHPLRRGRFAQGRGSGGAGTAPGQARALPARRLRRPARPRAGHRFGAADRLGPKDPRGRATTPWSR